MHLKRYGQYREDKCPFCENRAIAKNKQGLNVCMNHKDTLLEDIKCLCGSYLELRTGKFGNYFFCMNCGNISLAKGLSMKGNKQQKVKVHPKEDDEFILDSGKFKDFDYGIE